MCKTSIMTVLQRPYYFLHSFWALTYWIYYLKSEIKKLRLHFTVKHGKLICFLLTILFSRYYSSSWTGNSMVSLFGLFKTKTTQDLRQNAAKRQRTLLSRPLLSFSLWRFCYVLSICSLNQTPSLLTLKFRGYTSFTYLTMIITQYLHFNNIPITTIVIAYTSIRCVWGLSLSPRWQ